ncbi:hypothetical protein [Roseicella aquatilis]|uniref:DUF2946 domain-containing protein n=1 Tax=Roseicella aquatilis TaxID=2527868 RepID=A0A4V6P5V7_9PROT|nr:hypothetical protein [Roseicella aquatilis]TCZ55758.1 hypothetical protein EXY23_20725 [Roseicella aquatilis]
MTRLYSSRYGVSDTLLHNRVSASSVPRTLPFRPTIAGRRHGLISLLVLVFFVAALAVSTVALAYPAVGVGSILTGSECFDCAPDSDLPQEKGAVGGHHGVRCLCHGGMRADYTATFAPPALGTVVYGPIPREPMRTSRQDAPPLQPPRA